MGLKNVPCVLQAAGELGDEGKRYSDLPARLESKLLAFQREGVKFVLAHGGRALIADEMGLGKTVQAVAVMAAFKDHWPALIITPSSLRGTFPFPPPSIASIQPPKVLPHRSTSFSKSIYLECTVYA